MDDILVEQGGKWVQIQKKTFTRWANTFLKERLLKIDDLEKDLSDGVLLINLLEIISSKSLGKYAKNPKMRAQKLENTSFAINFLQREGIRLVNIGNEDIVDCKLKLILGLLWTVILRYQIHVQEGQSARSALLQWVRQQIPEYDIKNFTSDWNDGRAICALGNSLKPGLCANHRDLDPNASLANATLGIDLAEQVLEIPKVLAPEDMVNVDVDELSMMTYISYFRDWEENQLKKLQMEHLEKTPVPGRCRASGPGYDRAETNVPTEFTIESINTNARRVPTGGDPYAVTIKPIQSQQEVPVQIEDHNDGTYTVTYTPVEATRHVIEIKLGDKFISNNPKTIQVTRSVADASKCTVHGPGSISFLHPSNLSSGLSSAQLFVPAFFTIEAFNRKGYRLTDGGDPFLVKVKGPFNTEVPATVTDNNDGSYVVSYTPSNTGDHLVQILLRDDPVANSPYNVEVTRSDDSVDPMKCVAHGPGLQGAITSEQAQFTVETRNGKGEVVDSVPLDVDIVNEEGFAVVSSVKDNKDGTFTVTYTPEEKGIHTVDVYIRNKQTPLYYEHIQSSPFKVPVQAGTDAHQSVAFGSGLENGVLDTVPATFTIQAKDKYGTNMSRGGDAFKVSIRGPKGETVESNIKDNGDGTYLVTYQANTHGAHQIDVSLKNQRTQNSPFSVFVKQGAEHANSFIERFAFTIQAVNKHGTNKREGGDNFRVDIQGKEGPVQVDIKDLDDGTYLVSYVLPSKGEYTISVLINDQHIRGSPWKQIL